MGNGDRIAGAIDIGGTKTALGLIGEDGKWLARETFPTPVEAWEGCFSFCCERMEVLLARCGIRAEDLEGVGINVPGMYDYVQDRLIRVPYAGWRDVRVREYFRNRLQISRVYADNDVNSCALAECRFGHGRQYDSFFWMTVSTGIGGAAVEGGRLIRGRHNLAGEIGHVKTAYGTEAKTCACGARGCLEAHASGSAIGKEVRMRCGHDRRFAEAFAEAGFSADAAGCAVLARRGNRTAVRIYEEAGLYLARGIAAAANLLDPEAVFLGGGVAEALDLMLPSITRHLSDYVVADIAKIPILHTGLGYDAALFGAAALVFEAQTAEA